MPPSGRWAADTAMAMARQFHTATLLENGAVLVVGGTSFNGDLAGVELYDPVSDLWYTACPLTTSRYYHSATRLNNGCVLVAGGFNGLPLSDAELYDPAANRWRAAGLLFAVRGLHGPTLLADGHVLVTGSSATVGELNGAEMYDLAPAITCRARSCTTQTDTSGAQRAACHRDANIALRRCFRKTAYWSSVVMDQRAGWRAPKCMTQRATCGETQGAWPRHVICTPRRICKMVAC